MLFESMSVWILLADDFTSFNYSLLFYVDFKLFIDKGGKL